MKKAEFRAMLDAQGISRTDGYSVEPGKIEVSWSDNPRKDYGAGTEEWMQLKTSIKNEGVKVPVDVYYDEKKEKLCLAHGFRRMRAVQELIKEGVEFKKIRVNLISNNDEAILISHLSLNTGKPLNDVETASIIGQLNKRGFEPKEIAEKTGISQQKVYQLLEFDKSAGKALKDAVLKDEIKITAAKRIIKKAKTTGDQEAILKKAGQTKKKKRIRAQDIEEPTRLVSTTETESEVAIPALVSETNIKEVIRILSHHTYNKEYFDKMRWNLGESSIYVNDKPTLDELAFDHAICLKLLGAM